MGVSVADQDLEFVFLDEFGREELTQAHSSEPDGVVEFVMEHVHSGSLSQL
jgi:hypothetical protein